jgi:hypothetical protein
MDDKANKILATAGGVLFVGSAAILAGRAITTEADPTRRQLMSAGVIFLCVQSGGSLAHGGERPLFF